MLEIRTAGDPDDEDAVWTDLSPKRIADAMEEMGTPVSTPVVRDWLRDQGLGPRKIEKSLAGGSHPDRDAQFQRIAALKADYLDAGNPVFSVDTKAKEHLGQLYREGRVRTRHPFQAFDHDFPTWATGVVVPHGICDLARNRGHLNLGLSHDTSAFARDSFRWYWNRIGRRGYPAATSILWLCDCGGSNSARSTSSSRTSRGWRTKSASRFAWPTIRATARSSTPSSAASSRTWAAPARGCCSTRWRRRYV